MTHTEMMDVTAHLSDDNFTSSYETENYYSECETSDHKELDVTQ